MLGVHSNTRGAPNATFSELQAKLAQVAGWLAQRYLEYREFFDGLYVAALRALMIGGFLAWLLSWDWLCGVALPIMALLAGMLLNAAKDLKMRASLESSVGRSTHTRVALLLAPQRACARLRATAKRHFMINVTGRQHEGGE